VAEARQPGIRGVLLVGAAVVAIVLLAAGDVVFHTPLLIAVLVAGTLLVLWRILRPR
jgi:hypothetical protein